MDRGRNAREGPSLEWPFERPLLWVISKIWKPQSCHCNPSNWGRSIQPGSPRSSWIGDQLHIALWWPSYRAEGMKMWLDARWLGWIWDLEVLGQNPRLGQIITGEGNSHNHQWEAMTRPGYRFQRWEQQVMPSSTTYPPTPTRIDAMPRQSYTHIRVCKLQLFWDSPSPPHHLHRAADHSGDAQQAFHSVDGDPKTGFNDRGKTALVASVAHRDNHKVDAGCKTGNAGHQFILFGFRSRQNAWKRQCLQQLRTQLNLSQTLELQAQVVVFCVCRERAHWKQQEMLQKKFVVWTLSLRSFRHNKIAIRILDIIMFKQ